MTEMEKAFIRNRVEQKAERCAYARVFDREMDEVFVERLKAEFSAVMWLAIELGVLDEEEAERMLKEKERALKGEQKRDADACRGGCGKDGWRGGGGVHAAA